ncbi:DNA glycosylase AlkZ-like family protein [Streptomyces antnestii]|uniref:DNA glycosylase AlkZ-like family protein n=1 Tax=Streptomyces antnestii TaxID=2494256 RepID=UPI001CB8974F|nr:crosslink repair DNA glycosylase YcaQ family protein [Streptomyces sp. San01]
MIRSPVARDALPSDVARFALVQKGRVQAALKELADEVRQLKPSEGDVAAPRRLLPMWDSTLLAYADRGRVIPPAYRKHVTRVNGDVLPTVLVDGYVAGVWRVANDGAGIEIGAFHELPGPAGEALEAEARGLHALLAAGDLTAYRRYDHWWAKGLPVTRTRVLASG